VRRISRDLSDRHERLSVEGCGSSLRLTICSSQKIGERRKNMTLIRQLRYVPEAATGLCRTCSWGTVRRGFRADEAETFCRLVGPKARVRYAVRECSDYRDRRVTVTESGGGARRYGFVTEIKLEETEIRLAVTDESKQGSGK
jgi:hypothetical protein